MKFPIGCTEKMRPIMVSSIPNDFAFCGKNGAMEELAALRMNYPM